MVMIDDATNRTQARFFEGETTRASYDTLEVWAGAHGLPNSLYVDRDSIYRAEVLPTVAEQLAGHRITSYNVCYTKLLRQLFRAFRDFYQDKMRRFHTLPGWKQQFIRITSYNVCYTKLLRPSTPSAPRARG